MSFNFVKSRIPNAVYLFPAGQQMFEDYAIDVNTPIGERTLLNEIKKVDPDVWMHLFREYVGGKIAKKHGRTIESVEKVRSGLDLVKEETAWHYIRRSVPPNME